MSYYFDDNNLSTAKNLIKFNATAALAGDFGLSYERVVSDLLSFEAGFSMWQGGLFFYPSIDYPGDIPEDMLTPSFFFQTRFYYTFLGLVDAPSGLYNSFMYRRRQVDYTSEPSAYYDEVVSNEVIYHVGYQWLNGARFAIDTFVGIGVGFMDYTLKNPGSSNFVGVSHEFMINLGTKFAYRF